MNRIKIEKVKYFIIKTKYSLELFLNSWHNKET